MACSGWADGRVKGALGRRGSAEACGGRGVWIVDRSGDRGTLYADLLDSGRSLVIRQKRDRHLLWGLRKIETSELAADCPLYRGKITKHFHEKLVGEHGFGLSYNWLRLTLQAHSRVTPALRRGAHRRKRPRRPMVGMLLHQDGSSHEWVPDRIWDLIVTLDDATSEIYSAFFVDEEGTMSSLRALHQVIAEHGLFCALYTDRGSHYWHTPAAGGKVDKDTPTQVGRALAQLGIELIPAYSPQARGRSERMFATLQDRLPKELALAGITTMAEANRFLEEVHLPRHNARFARPPEDTGSAFVPFAGPLEDILCIQEERVVGNDNTVRYKNRILQIPADRHRHHYVKVRIRAHEYPDGTLAVFHGPRCLARYSPEGEPVTKVEQPGGVNRSDVAKACGDVDNAKPLPTSPQTPQPQRKRSVQVLPKADNSVCYRHA